MCFVALLLVLGLHTQDTACHINLDFVRPEAMCIEAELKLAVVILPANNLLVALVLEEIQPLHEPVIEEVLAEGGVNTSVVNAKHSRHHPPPGEDGRHQHGVRPHQVPGPTCGRGALLPSSIRAAAGARALLHGRACRCLEHLHLLLCPLPEVLRLGCHLLPKLVKVLPRVAEEVVVEEGVTEGHGDAALTVASCHLDLHEVLRVDLILLCAPACR